jgi:Immunoglobulin-like domain of bacterial spore germination
VINRLAPVLFAAALIAAGCGSPSATTTTAPTTTARALRPIEVDRPAWNATVSSPFHVSGTASVYEATLVVELRRPSGVLARRTVTASEGAPGRGTFDTAFTAPPGKLVVALFAPSAANGEPQHEVDVPITVSR